MKKILKGLSKNQLTIVILATILTVLLALTVVACVFLAKSVNDNGAQQPLVPPEILEGEGIKFNYATAYPEVTDDMITSISVKNKYEGEYREYKFLRDEEIGDFVLCYRDANGDWQVYYPNICEEDGGFEYSDLYAIEMEDSFKAITKLKYLCMAIEAPYFSERIYLSSDPATRLGEEKIYGLDEESRHTIEFTFTEKDEDGKPVKNEDGTLKTTKRVIEIGDMIINGEGHYYRVDGRDYIYSARNNYFSYGLVDFASFIKATLVAEGLSDDNGFGPYLTPNYYQWVTTKYEGAKREDTASPITTVPEKSTVIVYTDTVYPSAVDTDNGRYVISDYKLVELDLEELAKLDTYKPLVNLLVGKGVGARDGVYYDTGSGKGDLDDRLVATVITGSKDIEFGDDSSKKYEYIISEIVSVVTENDDLTKIGTPVGTNTKIKVKYTYKINGELQDGGKAHFGVLDLTSSLLTSENKTALSSLSVGELSSPLTLEIDYTKENARKKNVKYAISEILSIFDQKGNELKKISDDSIVTYRWYYEIDGVKGEIETEVLNLKAENDGNDVFREALRGYGTGKFATAKTVFDGDVYYQELYDFTTYNIARIDYYLTNELTIAFRFKNATGRDPYYGESLYENLMTGKYSLYGLNSNSCEGVVKVLGGISNDNSAGVASGLYGSETVAVGLTPEVKEKYGLYAHKIYFELPRQIEPYEYDDGTDSDEYDDYYWYDTLAFTLYISEVDPIDGTRYVGSDMYDVVTKIKAEDLAFLDYDFESFWARRTLVLMDVSYIDYIEAEFFMDDLYGSYMFDLDHKDVYVKGNKEAKEPPEGETGWSKFDKIRVDVTPRGECTESMLIKYISEKGYTSGMLSLTELYDYEYLEKYKGTPEYAEKEAVYNKMLKASNYDYLGTAYFKEAIRALYLIGYSGTMTEEEQSKAIKEENLVMRLSFKLLPVPNASSYEYVYSFYRADDRRVLVSIHQEDSEGNVVIEPVSSLYVSTFALKKIANNLTGLLNAQLIDPSVGYPEDVE